MASPAKSILDMGSNKIIALLDGTASTDAINLGQLNQALYDRTSKDSVLVATTANITLSGTQTIDGISVTAGQRVLVKNQTTGSQNGIYASAAGAWTREPDFDSNAEADNGLFVYVRRGTAHGGQYWKLDTVALITIGTTSLSFSQVFNVSGTGSANKLAYWTGSTGLSFDSNVSIDATNDRIGLGSGATTPVTTLHVAGIGSFGDSVTAGNAIRGLNLCDTAAVLRVMRISANSDTAAPGVELKHRTSADGVDTLTWDFYADSNGFKLRDRTGSDNIRMYVGTTGFFGFGASPDTSYRIYANAGIRGDGQFYSRGVGDTITDASNSSVRLTNTTVSTGDSWYIHSKNNGAFDITAGSAIGNVLRITTGTGLLSLAYSFALPGAISPGSIAANQNNFALGDGGQASIVRLTSSGNFNITGLAGGVNGRILTLINIGANILTFKNLDANSLAANQFALGADVAVGASQSIKIWYDGTSSIWRPMGGSGGGSGAPSTAQYLTLATDATLANERVFTPGNNVVITDGGAGGNYTVAVGTQTFTLNGIISPTGTTGTVNDYAPTSLSTAAIIRQTTTAATSITGLTGGASGRMILFFNIGTHDIDFLNEVATSAAGNRFAFGVDYRLAPNKSLLLWYDSSSTRWRAAGIEDDAATRVNIQAKTANYTLVLSDAGKFITMNSASATVLTIPLNSSAAFQIGTVISLARTNTGSVSVAATGGVTLNSADSDKFLRARYSGATLLKTATDTWLLTGDLTAT